MINTTYLFAIAFTACLLTHVSAQEVFKIGVIGKTKKDSFYEQSFQGCQKFAHSHGDVKCLYGGPEEFQDIREQAHAAKTMLKEGIDGILLSTTDSHFMVSHALKLAKEQNIPVITFDSDLLPEHSEYRLAYVGTDNFEFGVALGNYAKQYKQQKITEVCIQSGHKSTPNLDERIKGVRFALSGKRDNTRLDGENGWIEYIRCPFYNSGKRDMALNQLELLLKRSVPMYIAVAGFAQFSPDYIRRIEPYKSQIVSNATVVISADTELLQLDALKRQLSTVNVGQRPFEMGRLGTELIYDYLKHGRKPARKFYYLGFHTCTPQNADTCTAADAPVQDL
jgi:ribose transport system substrate-binding protein